MIIFFQPKTFLEEIYINCKKKFVSEMSIIIFIVCKGAEPRFQARHVSGRGGGIFSEILVRRTKRGVIQYFVVVQWGELVKVGQFFLNQLQK